MLLALIMVISAIPVQTFATEDTQTEAQSGNATVSNSEFEKF